MIITPGSISLWVTPSAPAVSYPAQIASFEAYYTRNPASPCGAAVCINFYPLSGASISKYAIYRSVVGFVGTTATPAAVNGKTLLVSVNLGPTQTVLFDGTNLVIDRINQFVLGGRAVADTVNLSQFIFRADGGSTPGVVQIVGGTAMADLNVVAGTYSLQSHDSLVTYVAAQPNDDKTGVEYCDPNGTIYDSYRIATVNLLNEISDPTNYTNPTDTTGKMCWVYGVVSDPAGVRVPDAEVTARIKEIPQCVCAPTFINNSTISTVSDPQGRFEIGVLQGSLVEITIPSVFYTHVVRIPPLNRVAITDLFVDNDYKFPPEVLG